MKFLFGACYQLSAYELECKLDYGIVRHEIAKDDRAVHLRYIFDLRSWSEEQSEDAVDALVPSDSLIQVLGKKRSSKATDTRNAVFSKLGLARNSAALIVPSYDHGAAQVFTNFVRSYLEKAGSLYTICLAASTGLELPSWALDWSRSAGRYLLLSDFGDVGWNVPLRHLCEPQRWRYRALEASSEAATNEVGVGVTFSSDLRAMVCGWEVDTIVFSTSDVETDHDRRWRDLPLVLQLIVDTVIPWEGHLDRSVADNKFSLGTYIAFAKFLLREHHPANTFGRWAAEVREVFINGTRVRSWAQEYVDTHRRFADFTSWIRYLHVPPLEHEWEYIRRALWHLCASVPLMGEGRRLMATKCGLPVLAPENARDGDIVCVLWHCPVPVILRQVEHHFVLVGKCCVHGYMNGYELGDEAYPEGRSERLKQLCWEKLAREGRQTASFEIW